MFRKRKALEKRIDDLENRVKLLEEAQNELLTVAAAAGSAVGEIRRAVEELRNKPKEGDGNGSTTH